MKALFKSLPVEFFVIALPAIAVILTVLIGSRFCGASLSSFCTLFSGISSIAAISPRNLIMLGGALFLGLFSITWCMTRLRKRRDPREIIRHVLSFFAVFGTLILGMSAMGLIVIFIFRTADPERTVRLSHMLMRLDRTIFGVYPPLWLNDAITSPLLGSILIRAYDKLIPMMGALVFLLPFRSIRLFRIYVLAYFFAFYAGAVLWSAVPVLDPNVLYVANPRHASIPAEIESTVRATHFSPEMQTLLKRYQEYWIDASGRSLGVSNFPSMHAAWGIVIAAVAIEAWAPLAIVAIPWLILELVSAVYTMQHFAVDIIAGVVIGWFAYRLAKRLLRREEQRLRGVPPIFSCLQLYETSFARFCAWMAHDKRKDR